MKKMSIAEIDKPSSGAEHDARDPSRTTPKLKYMLPWGRKIILVAR
jgi:hypothetical protein